MSTKFSAIGLVLLSFSLCWFGVQGARGQDGKQTLVIHYPNPAIVIDTKGTRYNGIIYVRVFQIGKNGPVATAELTPSTRDVMSLPLGEYEVHFGMRTGSEMKTFVLRNVILRAERATALSVEMNAEAKTTVIGGSVTMQQMETAIALLARDVQELKKKSP